jgi:CHAD domain-containing protein
MGMAPSASHGGSMIKERDRSGAVAVTFTLPSAVGALHAAVCGEWNDWSPDEDVMDLVESGFVRTILLDGGRPYRFRYLLDGSRWENDWAADRYVPNPFGGTDSVLDLTALPWSPREAPYVSEPPDGEEAATPQTPPASTAPSTDVPPPAASTAAAVTTTEREAKLVAPASLGMPNLDELVPGTRAVTRPVQRLDATYYDTPDLRLARSGITVRHRGGESGPAWTVKLPEDGSASDLVRREIRFEGSSDRVPNPAADLVLASTRMRALAPVARLTTVRRPIEIRDGAGQLLAEVVDDTVSVSHDEGPVGRFREVEVELHTNGAKGRRLLDAALTRLVGAGCDAEPPVPKLVRALGEPATLPPDVVVPPLPDDATVIDLVRHSVARSVALIIRHDPGARLGDDEEEVHKLRVATRRLRSDLHSFGPLLDKGEVKSVRTELSWLGGVVGAVRDTDVLRIRLATRLDALSAGDAKGADRLMSLLGEESAVARGAMTAAMRDRRYLRLLDALVELAAAPPFVGPHTISSRKSRKIAVKVVEKPWHRVVAAVDALGEDPSDTRLHAVRILAKRSRYAAEATAPLLGPTAVRFAAAVADLQTVLGDHQDTVLAEEWLRRAAAAEPDADDVVQELIAVEQSRRRTLRTQWPAVWQKAATREMP